MMSFLWSTVLISAVILYVIGNPEPSGANLSIAAAEAAEPMYTCVCDPCEDASKTCTTTGRCYVHIHKEDNLVSKNCFKNEEQSNLNCHSNAERTNFECCRGNLCNMNLTIKETQPATAVEEKSDYSTKLIIGSAVVLCVVVVILVILYMVRRHVYKRRAESLLLSVEPGLMENDGLCKEYQERSRDMSSGSGSGLPYLVPQTVGKQVSLIERIGKGRFGEVWLGKWLDADVAVKTFSSLEESSFIQETEIYSTALLRHENILNYYASDTVGIRSCTQNWLIVDYHRNGSLYDYLQRSDIDMEQMLTLAHSIAAGLSHLHNEILGGKGNNKPAIAHRDIKSKNILVKDNGQCCIGDLGHAVRNARLKEDAAPKKLLVGTKRYMAPEVLMETLDPRFFENFKWVDVYAFGLVLWEICRRARPFSEEYRIPYWDKVPSDPSFEDMKRVVGIEQQRPPIPNKWGEEPLMCKMSQLMQECWAQNPRVRLTILRIKKNLSVMLRNMTGEQSEKLEKLPPPKILDNSSSVSSSGNSSGNYSGKM